MAPDRAPRIDLLGVNVTAFDLSRAVAEMEAAVEAGRPGYACCCPVYTLMLGHDRSDVRGALNGAAWVTPDGMPVVWSLRALGSADVGRVYGPDLMAALTERSRARGWSQFYLGGAPGTADEVAGRMRTRFPGLEVAGTYCPPFRDVPADEERGIIDVINASGARIVWVGLGSPKQDLWMARHRGALQAPLLVGVGAAFDFLTGRQRQAPRWVQRSGIEWLFRLASEPRRLWRRYLVYNPRFVIAMVQHLAHHRSRD